MSKMKEALITALRIMGPSYLKPEYANEWSIDNPTRGYCYVVSELFYYIAPKENYTPYIVKVNGENHWFLKTHDGRITDFTADQYKGTTIDYDKARKASFLTKTMSKRCKVLATTFYTVRGKWPVEKVN